MSDQPLLQYQILAWPVGILVGEDLSINRWYVQATEPVREPSRPVEVGYFVTSTQVFVPSVTWPLVRLEQPVIAPHQVQQGGMAVMPLPIGEPLLSAWWDQPSEPLRQAKRPIHEGIVVVEPDLLTQRHLEW